MSKGAAILLAIPVFILNMLLTMRYQSQQKAQERQQVAGAFSAADFSASKSSSSTPKSQPKNLQIVVQPEEDLPKRTANGVDLNTTSSQNNFNPEN